MATLSFSELDEGQRPALDEGHVRVRPTRDVIAPSRTPTAVASGDSDLVERWFAELTNEKLRRGPYRSVRQLNADIRAWMEDWNENPRPYVWTKTAERILESIASYCQRINPTGH